MGTLLEVGKNPLIIHPRDPSTEFLSEIYGNIDATVIRGNVSSKFLKNKINEADQVMMLGHGTVDGLLGASGYMMLDDVFIKLLKQKPVHGVYIFCHASYYTGKYMLPGFATGMFISEVLEAKIYGLKPIYPDVEESNRIFASVISDAFRSGTDKLLAPKDIVSSIRDSYMSNCFLKRIGADVPMFNGDRFTYGV